jgi:hypothetical protein
MDDGFSPIPRVIQFAFTSEATYGTVHRFHLLAGRLVDEDPIPSHRSLVRRIYMTSGRCGHQQLAQAEARVIRMASLATVGVFHGAERERSLKPGCNFLLYLQVNPPRPTVNKEQQ